MSKLQSLDETLQFLNEDNLKIDIVDDIANSNISFLGKNIEIFKSKNDTPDDVYKTAEFLSKDKILLSKVWKNIIDRVYDELQKYISQNPNKYKNIDFNKKSIKLNSIIYYGRKSNKASFGFSFSSNITDIDNHIIFVDECYININDKSIKIPYVTFEG